LPQGVRSTGDEKERVDAGSFPPAHLVQTCGSGADHVVGVGVFQGSVGRLRHTDAGVAQPEFILPPNLDAWFKAPPGHYRHAPSGVDIENPDFVVTWNVHRTQEITAEGQHEWWEWVPNVEPPQVGSSKP